MEKDKYIGTIIGNYKIIELCSYTDKTGHKLYNSECLKCGHIIKHKRITELKRTNNEEYCHHCDYDTNWKSVRLRKIFNDMCIRCYNIKDNNYSAYGGRGISICDEWLNNPQIFNDWAITNGYNDSLTIDRISSDGNYCPENCRWVTKSFNSRFRGNTYKIEINNIIDTAAGWSRRIGKNKNYISRYIKKNGFDEAVKFIKNNL